MLRTQNLLFLGLTGLLSLSQGACTTCPRMIPQAETSPTTESSERSFVILSINDVYRIGGLDEGRRGGLGRVRTLRAELQQEHPDLLMLHAGDFLFPSLMSNHYLGEQMVDVMNRLDGAEHAFDTHMLTVFGNHELDKGGQVGIDLLNARLRESQFRWLRTNLTFQDDPATGRPVIDDPNLIHDTILESGGVRVGLFGLTLDEASPDYVRSFEDPIDTARRFGRSLRERGAEVVVALTHQTLGDDIELLEALGDDGPDLVIGGHEHNFIQKQVNGRWILKADADAATAWVVEVRLAADGTVTVTKHLEALGPKDPAPDPDITARVRYWTTTHGEWFCSNQDPQLPEECLDDVMGHTRQKLLAEELEIRRFETNFGNWIADQARLAFAGNGADVAFINSGGLRLNQDLPAGPVLRRHIEGLLPFGTEMHLLEIDGATLQKAMEHAVSGWTGNGHFAQISGFAFRHDPAAGTVTGLTLLTPEGPRPVRPDETLRLVTNQYLVNVATGQDGYTMLDPEQLVPDVPARSLRDLLVEGLQDAGDAGIAPQVEGRICTVGEREEPCLAVVGE